METSLFDTSFLKYDPSPPSAFFRPSLISAARPLTFPRPSLIRKTSADRCRTLIDRTKEFLQEVYENQHTISKDLFTRTTEKTRELLRTLVMWEKHGFSEGPQSYHKIEQLLNEQPTFTELCDVLLPKLAPMWKAFCTVINFDDDGTTLAIIDQKYHGDPEECCREVLRRWLSFKRPTWLRVIDYLRQAKCTQLARDVEELVIPNNMIDGRVTVKYVQLNALKLEYMAALLLLDWQEIKTTVAGAHENGKILKMYNGGELKLTAVDTTIEDNLIRKFIELKGKVAEFFEHEANEILKQLKKKTSSAGAGREWHVLGQLLISLRFIHSQVGG